MRNRSRTVRVPYLSTRGLRTSSMECMTGTENLGRCFSYHIRPREEIHPADRTRQHETLQPHGRENTAGPLQKQKRFTDQTPNGSPPCTEQHSPYINASLLRARMGACARFKYHTSNIIYNMYICIHMCVCVYIYIYIYICAHVYACSRVGLHEVQAASCVIVMRNESRCIASVYRVQHSHTTATLRLTRVGDGVHLCCRIVLPDSDRGGPRIQIGPLPPSASGSAGLVSWRGLLCY